MKKILRSSLSSLLFFGACLTDPSKSGTRILCYHRTSDEVKGYLSVPVSAFHDQMQFLYDHGYKTISLGELVADVGATGRSPLRPHEKKIVITFDDGYFDNYEKAFPVLKKFGFKATIFCVAEFLGRPGYLSEMNIHEIRAEGFEFGSHTVSHPRLPELYSAEKWKEISQSKKMLEDRLGFAIDTFCYPFGQYDKEAVEMVEKAGYAAAVSNRPGANRRIEPFLLKRTEIGGEDTLEDFERKLAGAFDLLHQGLHLLRGRP